GIYGTDFVAVEPDVGTGVLNLAGGPFFEGLRLGPDLRGTIVGAQLAARVPSLINAPVITRLDGVAVSSPQFNENMPLRDGVPLAVELADGTDEIIRSPVTNTVAGAMDIQQFVDNTFWVSQGANPVAYAPHLRKDPLRGIHAKSVIFQFAKGDQTVQNPIT